MRVARAVEGLRYGLDRLRQRSAPPSAVMLEKILGAWVAQGITVAADLKVADALADGPLPIGELAQRVGANPDALARLMRALIGEGVFTQRRDGRYALNALGETLRTDAPMSVAGMARMVGHPAHREHWSALLDAVRTGEATVPKLRGMPGFEYLAQNAELGEIFNDAMTNLSETAVVPLTAAYDFSPFAKILDVGGGHGRFLAAILAATPSARGVLYDLPQVVEGAPELLGRHGVADRVEIVGGSFFDSVPAGANAYVAKNVIHDWPDDQALTILRNIRAAADTGAVLLLAEFVIPEHPRAFIGNWTDLEMLMATAARERTEAEYRKLFEQAGFQLTRVVPTVAPISLIEGRAV
ncbi:hydroxyneurosporene-O-methyltransferase [Mycolicibacterium litorale]|uniref:Hydroxyneurosporene-O-methyltransferase n=1 Tax=Mycolicibacterium litorale TaxID=758802 RepID=A0AAD1MWC4_9MYCO|nr:hydroxyneurosporene-O-methyltransferase [Mycolicibacterium litorale]BBY18342.1 hydroxyneurosporene-O-methyltransferase [Mycolicibacterium litorale]